MKKYAIALLCAVAFASSASTVTSAKEIRTPFPNEIDAELHSILCYTPESYTADDESRELFLAAIEDARMLARAAIEDDLEAAYDESGEKCSVVDTISVDFNANPTPVFRDDKCVPGIGFSVYRATATVGGSTYRGVAYIVYTLEPEGHEQAAVAE